MPDFETTNHVIETVRSAAQRPLSAQGKALIQLPRGIILLKTNHFTSAYYDRMQEEGYTDSEVNRALTAANKVARNADLAEITPAERIADRQWRDARAPMTREVLNRFTLLADRALEKTLIWRQLADPEAVLETIAAQHLVIMGVLRQNPKSRATYHTGTYFNPDEITKLRTDFPVDKVPDNAFLIGMLNLATRKRLLPGYLRFCARGPLKGETNDNRYTRYMKTVRR